MQEDGFMFGLEKKKRELFKFDLEKELETSPGKATELLKKAEERVREVKNLLRQGTGSESFDHLGVLLNGYIALQRTLTRIANKK